MTAIIFIHGTGVRKEAYEKSFAEIQQALTKRPDIRLFPCVWGDACGARLHDDGASIPFYDTTLGPPAQTLSDKDAEIMLWAMLYQDALYELRALRFIIAKSTTPVPGSKPLEAGPPLGNLQNAGIQGVMRTHGLEKYFNPAAERVIASEPYAQAVQAARGDGALALPVARAIVATMIFLAEAEATYIEISVNPDQRDAVVDVLEQALSPSTKDMGLVGSIAGWMKAQLAGLAVHAFSGAVENRRGRYTDKVIGKSGDILLYQARGEGIRRYIRDCINEARQADETIVLLAHSLGGIAAVDLLATEARALNVALLITVGSQAGLLYEINALWSLDRFKDQELPLEFPRWLNIFDRRDFLSYAAVTVFNRQKRLVVEDVMVDNRQPFPQSHSAYWSNQSVWKEVLQRLP